MDNPKLTTFAAFADDPNLSRTAKRLHLSQPAVHAQLRSLAEDLGVTLYRRSGRGLALSAEGVEVAAYARDEARRASELRARLRGEMAETPPVVIAAGAGAIVHLLAPGFRAFGRSAKRPRLEVITADAGQAVDLVRSGRAAIGVAVTSPPSELEARVLAHAEQVAVLRRGDERAKKRRLTLDDLADAPLILPPDGGPQRIALDLAFGSRPKHIAAVARGWDVVLRLVEVGIGVGIVNATCRVPRSLVTRPLPELHRVTYLAFTRPRPRPAVTELIAAIEGGIHDR